MPVGWINLISISAFYFQNLLRSASAVFHVYLSDIFPSVLRAHDDNTTTNTETCPRGVSLLG